MPGDNGFEPGVSILAQSVATELLNFAACRVGNRELSTESDTATSTDILPQTRIRVNQVAEHGERVFDVVLVEPDSWWLGWHTAHSCRAVGPAVFHSATSPSQ